MRQGVVRMLPDDITRSIGAHHAETRTARHLVGFEYATEEAARHYRIVNEAKHGYVVVGPLVLEGVGIVNLVVT